MAELTPEPLAEYGGVIYKVGNVYFHKWHGGRYYFDNLAEAVEDALRGYSYDISLYYKQGSALQDEEAGAAMRALLSGKRNVKKAAEEEEREHD